MNNKKENKTKRELVLKDLEVSGFTNYQRLTLTALAFKEKNNAK